MSLDLNPQIGKPSLATRCKYISSKIDYIANFVYYKQNIFQSKSVSSYLMNHKRGQLILCASKMQLIFHELVIPRGE